MWQLWWFETCLACGHRCSSDVDHEFTHCLEFGQWCKRSHCCSVAKSWTCCLCCQRCRCGRAGSAAKQQIRWSGWGVSRRSTIRSRRFSQLCRSYHDFRASHLGCCAETDVSTWQVSWSCTHQFSTGALLWHDRPQKSGSHCLDTLRFSTWNMNPPGLPSSTCVASHSLVFLV